MTTQTIEMGQKCAFIRDNALVLYFDKAETPFVARYDLDSLAQATFEVTQQKEGVHTLRLRDYSGRTQDVGEFTTKADAHQALYTILQALLQNKQDNDTGKTCGFFCRFGCFFLKLLKWVLISIGVLVLLYGLAGIIPAPQSMRMTATDAPAKTADAVPVQPSATDDTRTTDLTQLPEGEAVDADAILAPSAAPASESAEAPSATDTQE